MSAEANLRTVRGIAKADGMPLPSPRFMMPVATMPPSFRRRARRRRGTGIDHDDLPGRRTGIDVHHADGPGLRRTRLLEPDRPGDVTPARRRSEERKDRRQCASHGSSLHDSPGPGSPSRAEGSRAGPTPAEPPIVPGPAPRIHTPRGGPGSRNCHRGLQDDSATEVTEITEENRQPGYAGPHQRHRRLCVLCDLCG